MTLQLVFQSNLGDTGCETQFGQGADDGGIAFDPLFDYGRKCGQVNMPLQETFFSPAYGQVTDKFGVTFHIHTEGKQ